MDPISLFTRYSTNENRITNYCMLFLRLMTEENPLFLRDLFKRILPLDRIPRFGIVFSQQQKNEAGSIPDGVIVQAPVCIHFEFKTSDWFHLDQLRNHADGLRTLCEGTERALILVSSSFKEKTLQEVESLRENYPFPIAAVSYYDLLRAMQEVDDLSKGLKEHWKEFRCFLEDEGLLYKGELIPHHRMLGVKLSQTYQEAAYDPAVLYERTRKAWRLDQARLGTIEYVLCVYRGIVREIYRPLAWHRQEDGRMFFDGVIESDPSIRAAYLYREVKAPGRNATFYLIPEEK